MSVFNINKIWLALVIGTMSRGQSIDIPSDTRMCLQKAALFLEQQNWSSAEQTLRETLRRWPKTLPAQEMLAFALTSQGHIAEATPYFRAVAAATSTSAPAHQNLAANLAALGQNQSAEQEFQAALALEPSSYPLNHNVGEFYARLGRKQEAIRFLSIAQELSPEADDNGYDLAILEIEANQLEAAKNQLKKRLARQEDGDSHVLLGEVYERQEKYLKAAAQFQQAAQLNPTETNMLRWAAELIRHRTFEPAREVLQLASKRYPESSRLQIALAITLYGLGDTSEAINLFCHATTMNPNNPQPYFFLAQIEEVPEQQRVAVSEVLGEYLQLQPRNPLAHVYYARSLWDGNHLTTDRSSENKIRLLLAEAIRLDPKCAPAYLQQGLLEAAKSHDGNAIKLFEKALQFDSSLELARYRLGRLLVKAGNVTAGRQLLKRWNEKHINQLTESQNLMQFIYSPTTSAALMGRLRNAE